MCRITDVDAFTFDPFKEFRIKEGVSPAGVNRDIEYTELHLILR